MSDEEIEELKAKLELANSALLAVSILLPLVSIGLIFAWVFK